MIDARVRTNAVEGLTVADVMHTEFTTMSPATTVAEARRWLDGSAKHRLALVVGGGHYLGSLSRTEADAEPRPTRLVGEIARIGSVAEPHTAASVGRDLARRAETSRVPVVDRDGRLVGVLALTSDERFFSCRVPAR